jgi:HlyD family secretion protein
VRRYLGLALVLGAAACGRTKDRTPTIQTAEITRRSIVIDAQATGTVEPINIVEVKSKASGQITKMTVETGTLVKPGDLLVQIDTRDVTNQYNQADADLRAAEAKLEVSRAQKKRSDEMFGARVITAQEHETAQLDFANSQAQLIRAQASLDLAKQRLEDATIRAPVAGTIIEKTVSLGQVITSATGSASGGTTLLRMADLNQVRVRALFNETDIGQIRSGQPATVVVDAFPDRRFNGLVEKIEPQAVINQNVTMFPVLVTLSNLEGLLKPGMNGEVNVVVDQRDNVLAVSNDAIKNVREGIAVAAQLGLNPDSVQAQIQEQFGNRGGTSNGRRGGAGSSTQAAGRVSALSQGDVDLAYAQGQQGGGNFQMPQVTDDECKAITAAIAKKPAEKKKLDDVMAKMRQPDADRRALMGEARTIYEAIGVDSRKAGACRRLETGGNGAAPNGARQAGAQGSVRPGAQTEQPLQLQTPETAGPRPRTRPGLVFIAEGNTFKPRVVMLGAGNFDYTEVVSGAQEGERVALLASLAIQAARQQQNDRMRQGMGVPGMTQGGRGGGGPRGR